MSRDDYLTIFEPGFAQTRVLGSRFLGSARSVNDAAQIDEALEAERKRYHDATHSCFAARLGVEPNLIERSSDAGEPKGTAGAPILREIRRRDLTDCLVLVTRYFGGTKLGTGHLGRAYAECAAQALDASCTIRKRRLIYFVIECPYEFQSIVYHAAQEFHATVEPGHSDTQAVFRLAVPASEADNLATSIREETRGRFIIHPIEPWI